MEMLPDQLRLILQKRLVERIKRNPRYSLRAFAHSLDIDASQLSRFLGQKRSLGRESLAKIVSRLSLAQSDFQPFPADQGQILRFGDLSLEEFNVISDWYHFAILELTRIRGFKSDSRWIARALGISVVETNAAIERLLRLRYLERGARGELKDISGNIATYSHPLTSPALKNQQKQILEMAREAIDEVAFEQRSQSAVTFAIDSADLPAMKKIIEKFRNEISGFVERKSKRNEVYQLSVSLFPLTKFKKGKNK